MLFGQSIFQSVVERLSNEEAEKAEREGEVNHYRVSGLNTGFVQENSHVPQAAAAWAQEQYLELMPDEEPVSEAELAEEEVAPLKCPPTSRVLRRRKSRRIWVLLIMTRLQA